MKKYIFKFFLGSVLLCLSMFFSCKDDFLDTAPTESTNSDIAIGTANDAYKALNGISRLMTTQHAYFGGGFCGENNIISQYENYPSQNYLYNYYASGWSVIMNQKYHSRTNSQYDAYAWYYYYSIIGNANSIICNIDNATGNEAEKKFVKASALTFRAYGFEKLAHYYCYRWQDSGNGSSQGLVLRLDESIGSMPYSTLSETYTQIYKDLDEAITLFNESGIKRSSSEVWIPNINVAHAVYARAALTKQDYSVALTHAKDAMEGYKLMSNDAYLKGFCNPTSEWIFGSYGDEQENNWYWSYGTQYACNGYYATSNPTGAGAIGRELINSFPNSDIRKSLFLTEDKLPSFSLGIKDPYFLAYGILGTTKESDPLWVEADDYCKSMTVSGLERPYASGYMYLDAQFKFHVFGMPGIGYLPFIRSSEMLLIQAEANYFLGNEEEAKANLISLNVTSGRDPEYTCSKSGKELWEEIMNYRELELWGEGFAWSDYKRWNRPVIRKSIADGGGAHMSIATTIPTDAGNKWTWEVPLNETDYNDELK